MVWFMCSRNFTKGDQQEITNSIFRYLEVNRCNFNLSSELEIKDIFIVV